MEEAEMNFKEKIIRLGLISNQNRILIYYYEHLIYRTQLIQLLSN